MRILKKKSQHRRDFKAIYLCEFCGHEEEGRGYDDRNFHDNVIPSMQCPECGLKAEGPTSSPDVPEGVVL